MQKSGDQHLAMQWISFLFIRDFNPGLITFLGTAPRGQMNRLINCTRTYSVEKVAAPLTNMMQRERPIVRSDTNLQWGGQQERRHNRSPSVVDESAQMKSREQRSPSDVDSRRLSVFKSLSMHQIKGLLTLDKGEQDLLSPHESAATGDVSAIRFIIKQRSNDLNSVNRFNQTMLHIAAIHRHFPVLSFLLQHPNIDIHVFSRDGSLPLHCLCSHRMDETEEQTVIPILSKMLDRRTLNQMDNEGRTPLMLAAAAGSSFIVRRLIDAGANFNFRDITGENVFHKAAMRGHTTTLKALCGNRKIRGKVPFTVRGDQGDVFFLSRNFPETKAYLSEMWNEQSAPLASDSIVEIMCRYLPATVTATMRMVCRSYAAAANTERFWWKLDENSPSNRLRKSKCAQAGLDKGGSKSTWRDTFMRGHRTFLQQRKERAEEAMKRSRIEKKKYDLHRVDKRRDFLKGVSDQIMRRRIMREICETERSYVGGLQTALNLFKAPLQRSRFKHLISQADLRIIFSDIEQSSLRLYAQYVNNYDASIERLAQLRKSNVEFHRWLSETEKNGKDMLDLTSHLILPIQRIPRYQMLLERLKAKTHRKHPDYEALSQALDKIIEVARYVNEKKREAEGINRVTRIEMRMKGRIKPEWKEGQASRRLQREGLLGVRTSKEEDWKVLWVAVFNDCIVLAKPKPNNQLSVKEICPLKNLGMINDQEGSRYGRDTFGLYLKNKSFLFECEGVTDKEDWVLAIEAAVNLSNMEMKTRYLSWSNANSPVVTLKNEARMPRLSVSRVFGDLQQPMRTSSENMVSDMREEKEVPSMVVTHEDGSLSDGETTPRSSVPGHLIPAKSSSAPNFRPIRSSLKSTEKISTETVSEEEEKEEKEEREEEKEEKKEEKERDSHVSLALQKTKMRAGSAPEPFGNSQDSEKRNSPRTEEKEGREEKEGKGAEEEKKVEGRVEDTLASLETKILPDVDKVMTRLLPGEVFVRQEVKEEIRRHFAMELGRPQQGTFVMDRINVFEKLLILNPPPLPPPTKMSQFSGKVTTPRFLKKKT
ncbi:RhoGEF domain-containing protein [Planoprotostelium fungivorum]|uniref:RhoGEF domain-containing protein n=1 Tax=Planoprotostelium fungivorum TaxID=1890364 RepID=A0A2P6N3X0_9EUKA|nr:RhoGEF domain-containing protein [Planoprotostelium fungivorum]